MCSLNNHRCGSNDDEINEKTKNLLTDKTLCRKCRCKDTDILLTGQSGYCKICFLQATNHKFRAALGKSKIIRHGDLVLVDHSGELNSTVLLHLIKNNQLARKKFIFKTIILYIDDGAVAGKTDEDRSIMQCAIADQIKDWGLDCYIVSLGQALSERNTLYIRPIDCPWMNDDCDKQLCEILTNLPDDTSRIDLLEQLHQKLLISVAQKLNCNKIFVADSITDIAANALGDLCLGRGTQLPTLAAFCDHLRSDDIKILKPIRDFTQQELAYYSECYELHLVKLKITDPTATSIQALVRNFTSGLELQFSGTVSTIFHTAEKLNVKSNMDNKDIEDNCVLCDAKLDVESSCDRLSAMRAIKISKLLSSNHDNNEIFNGREETDESNCCTGVLSNDKECGSDNSNKHDGESNKGQLTPKDIWKSLCYSCKLIFQDADILCTLPASLLSVIQER